MIHELFGMMDERKLSAPASLLLAHGSTISSPSSTPTMSSPNSSNTTEPQQNLRCPRCDSSNTKFCYYNNYNLTQPRHFCKTCRRYWTKGGALRNVPIGGGCRKVKPCRSVAVKPKPATNIVSGFDEELQSSAAGIWNPPYSSQLLDLLRNTQFQNPNPNSMRVKEEGSMASPHMVAATAGTMYEQGLSLDSLGQLTAAPFNSLWRSVATPAHYQYHQQQPQLHHHQHQHQQQQQQQQQQHNMFMGEMQGSSGIQELLQKLKSSANYNNYGSLSPSVSTSMGISSGAGSILEPLPLSGGEVGYWNPAPVSWADLSTVNGAFP